MTDFAGHLPPWLEEEIRAGHLSIVDLTRAGSDAAGPCDVLIAAASPEAFGQLAVHAARHLVAIAPFREDVPNEIEPGFRLSSRQLIRTEPPPRLLLVYSRAQYHEAALLAQVHYWQTRAADLDTQVEGQRREIETLHARAEASASEAAGLRRLTNDLLGSRSWKITAPLRFLSKPLLAVPESAAAPSTVCAPLESFWEELGRASSIAIVPCAVPFRSTFAQRPISCARYLADRGTAVVFVSWQTSPGVEPPGEGQKVYPRIFHLSLSAFQANLDRLAKLRPSPRPLYLCSLPTAALFEAVRPLRAGGYRIHYDIMDDWEEFHRCGEAPWYSASIEQELLQLADTVTVVSEQLAKKFAPLRKGIVEVRNGYDPEALGCPQFAAARAPLERSKVVGYFGHLSDGWFDWETIFEAARKLPGVEWELIGYDLSDRTRARLANFPNIRFSGLVAQGDLCRYAQRWWAGMIPFRASALSAAVDPLKVYEYLHFGLPVVVTGVSGIAGYPLVHYAADRAGFLSAVAQVDRRPSEQSLTEVADFLRSCTWEARLAKLTGITAAS